MDPGNLRRSAGAFAMLLGLGGVIGWQFGVAVLRSLFPGRAPMHPAAGLALALLGGALYLTPSGPHRTDLQLGRCAAIAGGLIGLLKLLQYLTGWDPGIDAICRALQPEAAQLGQISVPTTVGVFLAGIATLVLGWQHRAVQAVSHALALTVGMIALFALTDHAYSASFEPALALLRPMAVPTALALMALSVGLVAALPEYGLAGLLRSSTTTGALARRLLPVVLLVPVLLGWLRLRGERAGWYDTESGTALMVAVIVLVLAAFAWRSFAWSSRSEAERQRIEEALRESEQRHRLLFDVNPEPAWVFDLETLRFLTVNPAAVRKYGYTPAEFQDMTIRDIRPPEDLPRLMKAMSKIGAGASGGSVWRHQTKDGTLLEVEVVSHTLAFMGRPAQLVLAHDITERRHAEAALAASEERFRALAVSANDAIISADHEGRITYFNPGAEHIFGHLAAEVTGRPLTVLMPERFRDAHRGGFARYLATREAHVVGRTVELVGVRKDGSEFPVELSLASWQREDELAFTAILRDVTARKKADDAMKRYAAQLEVANAELDAFAYSVSHDLRAPLRSIDGFSAALLEDCADRLGESGRDHLSRVRKAGHRMAGLIDDLLALSRVTRAALSREQVDLSALARQIASELRQRDPDRQAEFVIPTDIQSEGDTRLLRIALENLLGNAWKYTARTPRARIEFGAVQDDGTPAYFVRDNGAGFDMRYADKLFGAFQRLHSAGEFEGSGIGLATVQRIVHRHGGRVWAEGVVGQGATFYFTL